MKSGLLTAGTTFVSPLLVQEVFRELVMTYPSNEIELDRSDKSPPMAQQIIEAGLANMKAPDFKEGNFSTMNNNERGLAHRWGVCAGAALKEQVWLTSEVVTKERNENKDNIGAKPTIDFVVNGSLYMGLELAKNRTPKDIAVKFEKLGKEYGRHDSYIFHFVFKGTLDEARQQVEQAVPEKDKQSRVYTFVKDYNTLLCGTKIVHKGVALNLSTPLDMYPVGRVIGARHFSTLAFGALRGLRRLV